MVTSAFSLAEYNPNPNPNSHNHQPFEYLPPADHDYPCFSDYLPTSDLGNLYYPATPDIQSLHKSWVSEFDKLVRSKAAATTINPRCSSVDKADEGVRKELSTEEIMRVAAARFVQSSAQTQTLSSSGLTDTEAENIELAVLLLSAAEEVSNHQFDLARHLLQDCYRSSSVTGNPTQRIIYYFSEALYERIDRETGRLHTSLSSTKRPREINGVAARNVVEAMLSAHPRELVIHEKLPFLQLMQFTSLQAIIDTVRTAKRIHMIDLSIRHGLQWAILLQSLADQRSSSPVEYVKIRAVGASEAEIAATGKRLLSFSASLGIPLDFKAVVVADMIDLRVEMFEVGEGEVVAAYSSMDVNPMIARPESLENLMRVMRRLRPSIMTVVDVEAKHNSPAFITRFSEALFFYSSFFDSLDFFLERDDAERLGIEGGFHSQGIKNIVAAEADDRVVRHVGIRVWRPYFARFGMEEMEMNEWATYQAGLLVNRFGKGSSCTVEKDGRSLLVGWKGTPIVFISAWRFC